MIPTKVPLEEPMVVAKYIDNPLLINGHKSDLRYLVLGDSKVLLRYFVQVHTGILEGKKPGNV